MIGAVNYPDVMLPAYVEDGTIALLYFGSFAVLFIFGALYPKFQMPYILPACARSKAIP